MEFRHLSESEAIEVSKLEDWSRFVRSSRLRFSVKVLWRNLNWATFCIKQKCVQIPPYLWCIIHHSLPLTFILITQETRSLKTFWGMRTKPWQFEKKSKLSSDTCWTIEPPTFIISHVIFCLCKLNGKGNYSRIKL